MGYDLERLSHNTWITAEKKGQEDQAGDYMQRSKREGKRHMMCSGNEKEEMSHDTFEGRLDSTALLITLLYAYICLRW